MSPPGDTGPGPPDPYSRLHYRRLIAWPERIRRESEFLERIAARGPDRSVVDLGCGPGEHARHFAARGYRVLGIDSSEAQIAAAREGLQPEGLRFELGDMTTLGATVHEHFGSAICLGNTLVHLHESGDLRAACRSVHAVLLPGGSWLTQILNYERIFARRERSLPTNVLESEGETLVFVRVLQLLDGGRVRFFPVTMRLRPDADPPMEIVSSRSVEHRGWVRAEIEPALREAGFATVEWYGDMRGGPFDVASSSDLIFVATRA